MVLWGQRGSGPHWSHGNLAVPSVSLTVPPVSKLECAINDPMKLRVIVRVTFIRCRFAGTRDRGNVGSMLGGLVGTVVGCGLVGIVDCVGVVRCYR